MLEISLLSKTYPGGVAGLSGLSLDVARGECVVVMGPSGAGKSTLLRLVAGLEEPSAGSIRWENREIHTQPAHLRGVAFLGQQAALFPHLDVAENLAVGLRMHQRTLPRAGRLASREIRSKVLRISELLRIETLLDRRPQQLSGGEQQRVALGRAMVRGAELWLFDEPLTALDSALRREILAEFLLLRRQQAATILYSTHDRTEALALADRIGVLGRGRLLQVDPPGEIVQNPRHRAVATCLGWPAMNFVDGKSEPQGSVFRFGFAGVSLELSTRQLIPGAEPADVVTLGVDPGRVLLTAAGNPPPMAGVPLLRRLAHGGRWTVERISPDGASDVTLRRGEALWQVVLWTTPADRDRIRPGREVEVWLCPAACHGFAADGRRVLAPRPE